MNRLGDVADGQQHIRKQLAALRQRIGAFAVASSMPASKYPRRPSSSARARCVADDPSDSEFSTCNESNCSVLKSARSYANINVRDSSVVRLTTERRSRHKSSVDRPSYVSSRSTLTSRYDVGGDVVERHDWEETVESRSTKRSRNRSNQLSGPRPHGRSPSSSSVYGRPIGPSLSSLRSAELLAKSSESLAKESSILRDSLGMRRCAGDVLRKPFHSSLRSVNSTEDYSSLNGTIGDGCRRSAQFESTDNTSRRSTSRHKRDADESSVHSRQRSQHYGRVEQHPSWKKQPSAVSSARKSTSGRDRRPRSASNCGDSRKGDQSFVLSFSMIPSYVGAAAPRSASLPQASVSLPKRILQNLVQDWSSAHRRLAYELNAADFNVSEAIPVSNSRPDLMVALFQHHKRVLLRRVHSTMLGELSYVGSIASIVHENLCKFYGAFRTARADGGSVFVVSELCKPSLSLFDALHSSDRPANFAAISDDDDTSQQVLLQIATALDHLHTATSPPVLHLNLCSHNVLLMSGRPEITVKVCDAGLNQIKCDAVERAQTAYGLGQTTEAGWVLAYVAPECFEAGPELSTKTDVYSFAILLWEVQHGLVPFEGWSPHLVMSAVRQGGRPELMSVTPYFALIRRCWHQNVASRPEFSQIIDELRS